MARLPCDLNLEVQATRALKSALRFLLLVLFSRSIFGGNSTLTTSLVHHQNSGSVWRGYSNFLQKIDPAFDHHQIHFLLQNLSDKSFHVP
jgi:hypothetical protein